VRLPSSTVVITSTVGKRRGEAKNGESFVLEGKYNY